MDRLRWILPICALVLIIVATHHSCAQDRSPRDARVPLSEDGGATINPEIISSVVDNTLGLTADDREAYFKMLKLAQMVEPDDLRLFAREFRDDRHAASPKYRRRPVDKFPVFVDLFQHPDVYRGHPVTLHGYFRRLVTYDAGKNAQGIETLHEGWLYPDAGQGNPAVVIFTEKPEGLPIGGDITEEISVTGYFLKMYGYHAHDAARKAPLILARSVRWHPQRQATAWKPSSQTYIVVTAVIVIASLIIGVGVRESRLERQKEQAARQAKYAEFVPPQDAALEDLPTPSLNGSQIEPHH